MADVIIGIQYYDLAYTAGLGFATVGANNGHNGHLVSHSTSILKSSKTLRIGQFTPVS